MKKIIAVLILINKINFLHTDETTQEQEQLQELANQLNTAQATAQDGTTTPTPQQENITTIKKNLRQQYL